MNFLAGVAKFEIPLAVKYFLQSHVSNLIRSTIKYNVTWSYGFNSSWNMSRSIVNITNRHPWSLFKAKSSHTTHYLPEIMKKLFLSPVFLLLLLLIPFVVASTITNDGIENCLYSKWILNDSLCLFGVCDTDERMASGRKLWRVGERW